MHPTALRWTLLCYAAPCWATLYPLKYFVPRKIHEMLLCSMTMVENIYCTSTTILYHMELGCTLLICAASCWTTLHRLSYAEPWASSLFVECRIIRHPVWYCACAAVALISTVLWECPCQDCCIVWKRQEEQQGKYCIDDIGQMSSKFWEN